MVYGCVNHYKVTKNILKWPKLRMEKTSIERNNCVEV
jgi:hypothetical protein